MKKHNKITTKDIEDAIVESGWTVTSNKQLYHATVDYLETQKRFLKDDFKMSEKIKKRIKKMIWEGI